MSDLLDGLIRVSESPFVWFIIGLIGGYLSGCYDQARVERMKNDSKI